MRDAIGKDGDLLLTAAIASCSGRWACYGLRWYARREISIIFLNVCVTDFVHGKSGGVSTTYKFIPGRWYQVLIVVVVYPHIPYLAHRASAPLAGLLISSSLLR